MLVVAGLYGSQKVLPLYLIILFGLLFVFAVLLNFQGALTGFVVLIPFQLKGYPTALGHLAITDVAILILLLVWVFRKVYKCRIRLPMGTNFLFLFILVVLFSFFLNWGASSQVNYFFRALGSMALLFILYDEIDTKERYITLLKLLVFTGVMVSLFLLFEFISTNYSPGHFDRLFSIYEMRRPRGLFHQPNQTAHFLAIIFPLALLLNRMTKNKVYSLGVAMLAGGILLTFSRGGIVMLGISILLAPSSKRYRSALLLVIITVALLFQGLFLETRQRSLVQRFGKYKSLPHFLAKSPLIGSGLNSYPILSRKEAGFEKNPNPAAHSLFIKLLVETGLIGSFLFGLFFLKIYLKIGGLKCYTLDYGGFLRSSFVVLVLSRFISTGFLEIFIWICLFVYLKSHLLVKHEGD